MKSKKLPLAFWIFVGLVIGIIGGLLLIPIEIAGMAGKDFAVAYIKPWGDIFLNLLYVHHRFCCDPGADSGQHCQKRRDVCGNEYHRADIYSP